MAASALDSQDLRRRLQRRLVWTTSAAVICAASALGSALTLVVVDHELSARQMAFDRYRGEIVDVRGDGSDSAAGRATVDFVQGTRHRRVGIDIADTTSFSEGPATVLVDPNDPSSVTLPGENYFDAGPTLALLFVGGFGVAAICFAGAVRDTRRKRRVLASANWQTVDGFVVQAGTGDDARWVLFLPDHDGGSFWVFSKALPTPRFTGSVAIDGRERLVHAVADGRFLVYATRSWTTKPWDRHRVTETVLVGRTCSFVYSARDVAYRAKIDIADLDDDVARSLTTATVVDLLAGPHGTVAVHVPRLGVVGIGTAEKLRQPVRERVRRLATRGA